MLQFYKKGTKLYDVLNVNKKGYTKKVHFVYVSIVGH